jgi:hypothetical protein
VAWVGKKVEVGKNVPMNGDIWSFYIFSGGGTADELFFREFDLEFFQEFGVFVHFLA